MYVNHTLLGIAEFRILELFLDFKRHYFAEISRKTKLTRPRTLRALRKLAEFDVLQIEIEANVKYYSLNKTPQVYSILSMVEYSKTTDFLRKNKILKRALDMFDDKYKDCLVMCIFGSYAKGYATKTSDVDLLLLKENFSKEEIKKIEDIIDIVNGRTGLKISPYLMKVNEFRQRKAFVQEIIDNHIILGGAELFLTLMSKNSYP